MSVGLAIVGGNEFAKAFHDLIPLERTVVQRKENSLGDVVPHLIWKVPWDQSSNVVVVVVLGADRVYSGSLRMPPLKRPVAAVLRCCRNYESVEIGVLSPIIIQLVKGYDRRQGKPDGT